MKSRFGIGLVILLVVLLGGAGAYLWVNNGGGKPEQPVTLHCAGGSEKTALMRDADVVKLLKEKYRIELDFRPMGSYKQVMLSADDIKQQGLNCLWPSSASAQGVFEQLHKGQFPAYRAQTVLQSPEVIYTGPQAADALVKAGLVKDDGNAHVLDVKQLLTEHVLKNNTWQQLGAGRLAGPVRISSTDARTSNSGFVLAQLQLMVIATEDVSVPPTLEQARKALPTMRRLYETAGLQAASSEAGFRQWLTQGGEYSAPLYAGYENQIIQLAGNNPNASTMLKDVRVLYPSPTIYSDHPILALDGDAARLIEAMQDPEIQKIAWERYGFRSALDAGINNVEKFPGLPLAPNFRTIPAPSGEVTLALLACLEDASKCQ